MDDKTSQGVREPTGRRRADGVHDRRPQELGRFVAASIILAVSLELSGRLLAYGPGMPYNVTRVFTLLALLVFGGSTWYVLRQVYHMPRLSAAVLLGTALVVFSESYGVISSLPFFAAPEGTLPRALWREMLHGVLEEGAFVAGMGFLVGSFYVSILEAEKAKRRLAAEKEDLIHEVAERQRAEDALHNAYTEIERRVAERTASLTETNQRLQVEIAERHHAEKALRESEKRYRTLAEASRDVIYIIDRDDVVEYLNSNAAEQLGLDRQAVVGRPRAQLFPPEVGEQQGARLRQVIDTGEPLRVENRAYFQGKEGWQDTSLVPLKDDEGGVVAVMGVSRDITKRKQGEDSALRNERMLSGIMRAVPLGISVINTHVMLWSNYQMMHLLGYSQEEHHDLNTRILFESDQEFERVGEALVKGMAESGTGSIETRLVCKNGSCLEALLLAARLNPSDPSSDVIVAVSDITERKQAEKLITEQRIKMVHAARMSALGLMAGGIAHEVKNPLAVISAGAQQLETHLNGQGADVDRIRKTTEIIIRNVERINGIIKALRSLSRESSNDPFAKASVREIVADAAELCQYRFRERGVTLVISESSDTVIECRASQLSQVLLNLLNNAYEATENLSEKWVHVDLHDEEDTVAFSVTDSGRGISPEAHDAIFVPFYSTKKEGKGVGLGLSISKRIIESHNGELDIDATCANTRFVMRVPKRQTSSIHDDPLQRDGV